MRKRLGASAIIGVLATILAVFAISPGRAWATCSSGQSSYSGVVSSTAGLIGYWRLGEPSGTVACDFTGHNNGSYVGGFTLGVPGAISGDPDTAVGLDGSTGQVSVPAAESLNVGDTFTIEGWVKRGSSKTGVNQVIASKQNGAWVLMFNESDRLTLRRSTVGDAAVAKVATTDTSTWHYVAATKSGSSVHLYLDGVDVTGTVTNQTMANNTQPLVMGQSTATAYLKGSVDEVALYSTVLTSSQIIQHYNAGAIAPASALSATAGNGTVSLGWSASPSANVGGYKIYRREPNGSWPSTPRATVSSSTLSYLDSGLSGGTVYTYRVTAYNSAGNESIPSNEASTKVVCSPSQSSYSGVVSSTPGLIGYWRLGEPSGTVACDFTGHNNGSYVGGFTLGVPGAISGDPDTAVGLDGSTGQVSVPAAESLNVGDTFTIEGWVKRGSSKTGVNQVIASKQNGAWVLMFNESDRLTLRRSTVGDAAVAKVATTDTSTWHYVAATKSGSSVHLYLDGVDVTGTVTNQTMANNTQPLVMGQSTATAYLKGSVDEVALYSTVLTSSQIIQHYNAGVGTSTGDPVLAAVGDIACRPGDTNPEHGCQQRATANLIAGQRPDAVAPLGDNQYESGLLSEYKGAGAYNETWGEFNLRAHPVPGNHEYGASLSAEGYFSYFGAAAGNGNYSYELGSWHIIALNSDCSDSGCEDSIAGTSSTAQVIWLQSDLAAHAGQCILAYWHHPRFTSGWVGNSPGVTPLWNALYAAHADVVLNGHDHMYERYAQQDPSQNATTQGIREFVVGTGGESLFTLGTVQPNLEAFDNQHYGALFLALHGTSYEWTYRAIDGTILDSGSTACHIQQTGAVVAKTRGLVPRTPYAGRQPSAGAPLAVRNVAALPAFALTKPASFRFAAHVRRVPLRWALKNGLPVRVHCSRACDVRITIALRRGRRMAILARYRETETQIPAPQSLLHLHLPARLLHNLRGARLAVSFFAIDASSEVRRVSGTFVLR
jgi:acid phosphatase type 7